MAGVLGWGQGEQVEASPRGWGTPSWVCGWGCALQPGLSPLRVYTLAHLLSVGVWGYTAFLQGAGKEGNSTALINPCETAEMGSHLKGRCTQAPRTTAPDGSCPWDKRERQRDRQSWPAASSYAVRGETSPVEKGLPWPPLPEGLNIETTELLSFGFPKKML